MPVKKLYLTKLASTQDKINCWEKEAILQMRLFIRGKRKQLKSQETGGNFKAWLSFKNPESYS